MAKTGVRKKPVPLSALILGVFAILLIAAVAWVGLRAALAYGHLQTARSIAAELSPTSFADADAFSATFARLSDETSAARELTSDPVWHLGQTLPWVGAQLEAVAAVSAGLDEIVRSLDPLADEVAHVGVDAFVPQDGVIDTAPFARLRDEAQSAATGSGVVAQSIERIDRKPLFTPVREALDEASHLVSNVAGSADALARATALLPAMLGADGPRDYLVLFQNNAEWRSLGGLVGSLAVIHTENGRFSLAAQDTGAGLGSYVSPPVEMPPEARAIFGTAPARFAGNITQIPDFTVDAPLAREFWRLKHGQEVDGVIAVDPVALSYLLDAIGPIDLPTGDTLTAANAVQLLLNDVYLRYSDPEVQNAFFVAAAGATFEAITSRPLNPTALLAGLGRAASENRIFIWSAHPDDQAVLDGTSLQGTLPATDASTTRFGVFVNDGTGSKMDYYMDVESSAVWCDEDGTSRDVAHLRVTLQSNAPLDVAKFTRDITGGGIYGVPPGITRTVAYVYLPENSELLESVSSTPTGFGGGFHENRRVLIWTTELAAQESATLDITVAASRTPDLEVVQTADINAAASADSPALCAGG